MPIRGAFSPVHAREIGITLSRQRTTRVREGMETMDYVALLRFRPASTTAERDAALARRAGWQYPAGVRLIAEYWPMAADVQVVSIVNTDDAATIFEFVLEWADVFDIDI